MRSSNSETVSRRVFVGGLLMAAGLTVSGCGRAAQPGSDGAARGSSDAPAASARPAMVVYRDPNCGCCEAWGAIARQAGYSVRVVNSDDMAAVKTQQGVPAELASCHTTLVGGYVVEGHVPMQDVDRLLRDRPAGVKGIAVAGMPAGSPGMERSDGSREPFEVVAFDRAGRTRLFRAVAA